MFSNHHLTPYRDQCLGDQEIMGGEESHSEWTTPSALTEVFWLPAGTCEFIFKSVYTQINRMGEFNSDDHYIYYCGQESLRRNGVAIIVNKSPKCSTWVQSQK